ncbi:hypothetical protein BDD43_1760 [Mucilaginibacter gracilis]|uniref:Uncharacterized protein n=1 Tax=Mucilaginibacter gracilis TaxID=423350 RepID=A0A495IY29_9SPHI|nr:hypothetical protein BDD43_1760 [Mucilaginibacter gracilis]
MRKYILSIWVLLVLFSGLHAFGQKQNVYYLKNNGKEVESINKADFGW